MTLIFSKNRAMQLELLLASMEQYYTLKDCYVLYIDQYKQYHKIDYPVTFVKQLDFKLDTEDIIRDSDEITFLCDDDVFFQNCIIPDLKPFQTFSLRLGKNIKNKKHFDYTISLDGNIFRTEDILPLMEAIEYKNPNKLESYLTPEHKKFEMLYKRQCLVGIPHNRVSDTSQCEYTGKWSEKELAEKFNEGYRLRNLIINNLTDVHADIDFNLVSFSDPAGKRFTWDITRTSP